MLPWIEANYYDHGTGDGPEVRLLDLQDEIKRLLALGDHAPAAPASELPLLRELRESLLKRDQTAPLWCGHVIRDIDALIARASAQAGGKS